MRVGGGGMNKEFRFEGSCAGETSGVPSVVGHYNTQRYGELEDFLISTAPVGAIVEGKRVVRNSYERGDAAIPSYYTFILEEV